MLQVVGKEYLLDYLSVHFALANKKIDKTILEIVKCLRSLVDDQSSVFFGHHRITRLCDAVDHHITKKAICCALNFRVSQKLALISGAGIAGLAASFELVSRGFKVVIVEKRKEFSRFNIINLNVEAQAFLKKFKLMEEFERSVAARIKEHRYVVIEKSKTIRPFAVSDVSQLRLDDSVSFEPKNYSNLFEQDGIYSAPIKELQIFLAEKALKAGVKIFGDAKIRVLARTRTGGVSKAQIGNGQILKPNLFFIAEGAHSKTALRLGMERKNVINACTGESWIFGNMAYSGKETFVISLIDASEKSLRIANVIFNSMYQVINIAVTSDRKDNINEKIIQTANRAFQIAFPGEKMNSKVLETVHEPVLVENQISYPFSMGNAFCGGDTAVRSSPLAGLGGTLGFTLVPSTVKKLIDDDEQLSRDIYENFNESSAAYARRWIQKSEGVKQFCLSIFDKEHAREEMQSES